MVQLAALFVCLLCIWGLFRLNREQDVKTSKALWIPTIWIFLGATRGLSEWINISAPVAQTERYSEGNPIDQVALATMLAFGLIVLFNRSQRVRAILRSNIPVVLYFLYCGISVVWSDFPAVSFKRWFRGTGDLIMVLVVLSEIHWPTALRRILSRVGFVAIPLSILFIRYFPALGRAYSRAGFATWTGVATGKNGLGMICLVFGLASLDRFLQIYRGEKTAGKSRILFAQAAMLSMTVYLLLLAQSATSFACFFLAAGPMVMIYLFRPARRPAFVNVMVLGVLGVSFSALFLNIGTGMIHELGRDSTLTGRTDIWKSAFSLVQNPILGTGYENFWVGPRLLKMEELIHQTVNQAHDGYIEVYLNLGWVGVVLLASLLIAAYRRVIASVRVMAPTAGIGLAYFITTIAYNFSEAAIKMMHPLWISLFLVTMIPPKEIPAEDYSPPPLGFSRGDREKLPSSKLATAGSERWR